MHGHIEKRGERFVVIIDMGRDERGKRQRHAYTQPPGSTKRTAEKFLRSKLHDADTGQFAPPAKQTLEQYLENWLATTARLRVAPRTLQSYRACISARIVPMLGQVKLDKLTPTQIQAAWAEMAFGARKDTKAGPLAAETVRTCHSVLRAALASAVRQGLLPRSPCSGVELPKARRREMTVLDARQMSALLEAARGSWLFAPVLLALTTGARRGEILALRWQDVDLENAVLTVARSLQCVTGQPLIFKEPKNGKPRRITMPAMLVAELTRHKAEQAAHRLRVGPCWQAHDLIVCHEDGAPIYPDTLTRAFAVLIGKTDLPRVRFHALRHSAATLLLARRVPIKVVSERLGHSNAAITHLVYSHVLPAMEREAAAEVDLALSGKKSGKRASSPQA